MAYRRVGTPVVLALDEHRVAQRRSGIDEFVGLADVVAQTPAGLDLHCIVDNLKTHSTDLVATFLVEHPHVDLHFTPTHASWLNQAELFFSILERRLLLHGRFDSVQHLADGSSPSSRTTTAERPRSVGPTTADP